MMQRIKEGFSSNYHEQAAKAGLQIDEAPPDLIAQSRMELAQLFDPKYRVGQLQELAGIFVESSQRHKELKQRYEKSEKQARMEYPSSHEEQDSRKYELFAEEYARYISLFMLTNPKSPFFLQQPMFIESRAMRLGYFLTLLDRESEDEDHIADPDFARGVRLAQVADKMFRSIQLTMFLGLTRVRYGDIQPDNKLYQAISKHSRGKKFRFKYDNLIEQLGNSDVYLARILESWVKEVPKRHTAEEKQEVRPHTNLYQREPNGAKTGGNNQKIPEVVFDASHTDTAPSPRAAAVELVQEKPQSANKSDGQPPPEAKNTESDPREIFWESIDSLLNRSPGIRQMYMYGEKEVSEHSHKLAANLIDSGIARDRKLRTPQDYFNLARDAVCSESGPYSVASVVRDRNCPDLLIKEYIGALRQVPEEESVGISMPPERYIASYIAVNTRYSISVVCMQLVLALEFGVNSLDELKVPKLRKKHWRYSRSTLKQTMSAFPELLYWAQKKLPYPEKRFDQRWGKIIQYIEQERNLLIEGQGIKQMIRKALQERQES